MAYSNCTIFVKNIPKGVENLADVLPTPAVRVKPFGRCRALITYSNEKEVQQAMQQLQDLEVMGKKLKVSTFSRNKCEREESHNSKTAPTKSTQTNIHVEGATSAPKICKYVYKLYASDTKLNFEQPPPPYLKYAYPAITPDILDAIGIALMSNTRFYTQVLHLMNRMNLEPPFTPKQGNVQPTGVLKDASTQTTHEINDLPSESIALVPAEDMESELESSSGDDEQQRLRVGTFVKRKAPPSAEQYKKKARKVLQASLVQQRQVLLPPTAQTATAGGVEDRKSKPLDEVFDQPTELKPAKIALNLKQTGASLKQLKNPIPWELPDELHTQRLTSEQMQELAIFKTYEPGIPSNKLYIKNLAKDVTPDDLLRLYSRFTTSEHLDVKVMQQGRMKGQAFVTFCNLSEMDTAVIVAKALEETHGFVLRQKPIVVCYGKKQLGLIETIYVDGASQPEKKTSPSYLTKFRKSQLCAQPYKYAICIDFEATCWENQAPPRWREAEIIEFPAVLINLKTGKIEAEFHKYVMPIESPKLSAFCTELTGVTQQAVDTGIPLQTALMMFQEWLRLELRTRNLHLPKMSKDKMIGNCAFVTWTDWDFGVCLAKECQRKRIKKPPFFNQWIDLRAVYREWYKYRPLNFADALAHVELVFEGREHCGRDDARNVGALIYKLVCDGAPLAITKDLTPFQLNSNCVW